MNKRNLFALIGGAIISGFVTNSAIAKNRRNGEVWTEIIKGNVLLKTMQNDSELILHQPSRWSFDAKDYEENGFHKAKPVHFSNELIEYSPPPKSLFTKA